LAGVDDALKVLILQFRAMEEYQEKWQAGRTSWGARRELIGALPPLATKGTYWCSFI
jgi:hypothetical protein